MHKIYSTDGMVLASGQSGEADRRLLLFTRDFGLVMANAQGVRLSKSKLKPHIELYSESRLSLVLGRAGWRLVGASMFCNHFKDLRSDKKRFMVVARIFSLLRKLLTGNEKDVGLYKIVSSGFSYLKKDSEAVSVEAVEVLLVLRILHILGYVGEDVSLCSFLEDYHWEDEVVSQATKNLKKMVLAVNKSFREGLI